MEFPEVRRDERIGRPEIATDPMGPDHSDTYVFLKPQTQWTSASSQAELTAKLSARLRDTRMGIAFSQPVKFRMAELTRA